MWQITAIMLSMTILDVAIACLVVLWIRRRNRRRMRIFIKHLMRPGDLDIVKFYETIVRLEDDVWRMSFRSERAFRESMNIAFEGDK
jgi:hypothetical protein